MRLLFAILGFIFLGGPIGAIIGFFIGGFFTKNRINVQRQSGRSQRDAFFLGLTGLVAEVVKADGNVSKDEILFIKQRFIQNFGVEQAQIMMQNLKRFTEMKVPVEQICHQISSVFNYDARLMIIHMLYEIAMADGEFSKAEEAKIRYIASLLGISFEDTRSAQGMQRDDLESCYLILEIPKSATDEELKRAYKKMAIKYHPDKVASLGERVQQEANERFSKINDSYDKIKKSRGI